MTIKQLFPTQRPALDLNFAQQKRLDSRVSLTRASIGTYVGSDGLIKTAAAHEARFDHDPVTGESLGLLVEENRTNLITSSEDLTYFNAFTSTSISLNQFVAPDGTTTADEMITTSSSGNRNRLRSVSVSGGTFTFSVFLKANTANTVSLRNLSSSGDQSVEFNLSTGVIVSGSNGSIIPFPNGWYRCSVTGDHNAGNLTNYIYIYDAATNVSIGVWGAQLEEGAFPTSYIPTTSGTVTRSADVVNLTNSSIYDTDSFTILNEPFGSAAGASTLSLVGAGETPIKRTAVYNQNLTQTQINASVGKTDEFWRWRVLGSSFGLPNFTTDGQVTVDWGDGTVETLTTSDHTFTDGGGYHDIGFRLDSGTYFRPYINSNATHKDKVVAIGPAPENMRLNGERAFYDCTNLEAFDATVDISGSDITQAWTNCTSLTSFPLIDTSSVTNFYDTWRVCSSLTSFPAIDTSSATYMYRTWENCSSLTSFPLIDTSSNANFSRAWLGCSSLTSFPLIDTSSGTNFNSTWFGCSSLTSFPLIDTSSGTDFRETWRNCVGLTSFPLIDTSSATTFTNAWYNCTSLTSFPAIDTSSGTTFNGAWLNCTSLTSFPTIDTSSGTNFQSAWQGCTSLTSFPLLDTSSATNFVYAWYNNNSLTSFPLLDSSSVTNFYRTWESCTSLTSFPLIDTSSGTNFTSTWYNCSSLTSFPLIDTSSGTNFSNAWWSCSDLTSFPLIDTSSGTNFLRAWRTCSSLTSFPSINTSNGTTFYQAWFSCTNLTTFPANFFDSWTGTPADNCFVGTWDNCDALTATSVENILNSIDTSGQSAPASGVDITIDYDTGTGTPSIATAVTNLKSRGWTITLNNVAQ